MMEDLAIQLHNMAATLADVLGKVTSNTAWLTDLDDTVVGLSAAVCRQGGSGTTSP
jgi:hypothetical protein